MVYSSARTVAAYLQSLPADRRHAIATIRTVIKKNLPKGYQETMNWGMICYEVPLTRYPKTYNGQPLAYVALGSQKNHMAIYLNNVYGSPKIAQWFKAAYKKSGKKLNMGKSCVRFTKLEQVPLEIIGQAIGKTSVNAYIQWYEQSRHYRP